MIKQLLQKGHKIQRTGNIYLNINVSEETVLIILKDILFTQEF